jgi:hypothetical protein
MLHCKIRSFRMFPANSVCRDFGVAKLFFEGVVQQVARAWCCQTGAYVGGSRWCTGQPVRRANRSGAPAWVEAVMRLRSEAIVQ